jgi:hypothetical protein
MYAGVPITEPAIEPEPSASDRTVVTIVFSGSGTTGSARPSTLPKPQSTTSTSPNAPSITLLGLRSRWITPRAWA